MKRHPLFLIYGLGLLLTATVAEYRGWTLFRPDEVRGVPKSIRDNPGAYRAIYAGHPRFFGGK
jgi:hypothetical protein